MATLVTGATGFVGRRLVAALRARGAGVVVLARNPAKALHLYTASGVQVREGDFEEPDSLRGVLADIDSVFHLAGYAHAVDEGSPASAERHQRITAQGTRALMKEACSAGVSRVVFASSIKAMGESTQGVADESLPAQPVTDYGKAKRDAELAVLAGAQRGMHVSVLRLSMVYGPEPVGNLWRMIAAVERGRFPPLPVTANRRSMVHVDDVVQGLLLAMNHPAANGQTYLVTDGVAYSVRDIYDAIRDALRLSPIRWSIPMALLRIAAGVGDHIGRWQRKPFYFDSIALEKLLGNACYSNAKICRELDYAPTQTLYTALPEMLKHRGATVTAFPAE